MKEPEIKPVVKLVGESSIAYAIIRRVKKALEQAGADEEYIQKYVDEAMSGDYMNLLLVTMEYVRIE